MNSDSNPNPCRFKIVCKDCLKVQVDERPHLCIAIKCSDYTICPTCKENRTIAAGHTICNACRGDTGSNRIKARRNREAAAGNITLDDGIRTINGTLTPPGTPPPGLKQHEVSYYLSRWDDYKGYYRDPAAYFICHLIVLEEINISHLTDKMILTDHERQGDIARARGIAINTMKTLTDQLPDKEAEEEMDDNKTISAIYDEYIKEKKLRSAGKVSRLLSPEALALAPELLFKVDPHLLLERCGYKEIDIEEAVLLIQAMPEGEKPDAKEILKFLGFKLDDEFALEYESPLIDNINLSEESA